MKRAILAVALLAPALVLAQDEGAGAPPGRSKKEPRRVLDKIVQILGDTEKRDAKSAIEGLRDAHWAVRAYAAIRLGVLGLDETLVRELRDQGRPGTKPPAADDKGVKAAEELAAKLELKKDAPEVTRADEGVRIYASLVRNELSVRRAPPGELRGIILSLPDYADAAEDKRALGFIARELLSLGDDEQIVKDLGVQNATAAVEGNGKRVFEWYRSNASYLYFHAADRCVRLDQAARSDGTPTDQFREKHPWGADEGPNAPAKKKRETK